MSSKLSNFSEKHSMNVNGKLVSFNAPMIMGILNTTPDSFYDGGAYPTTPQIVNRVQQMVDEGVQIIDVGGYSTRPGAKDISVNEELGRVIPVITLLISTFPTLLISIDTFRSKVAKEAINAGAHIINDISAGSLDKEMFNTVAKLNVPYVLMHMQGKPSNMQKNPTYEDVVGEVISFFSEKLRKLRLLGVNDVIIDPGFGFGKTVEQNYQLLKALDRFKIFNTPILMGVSRKSMINKVLGTSPKDALNGGTALHTIGLTKGVNIIRTHDVKAVKQVIKIVNQYQIS